MPHLDESRLLGVGSPGIPQPALCTPRDLEAPAPWDMSQGSTLPKGFPAWLTHPTPRAPCGQRGKDALCLHSAGPGGPGSLGRGLSFSFDELFPSFLSLQGPKGDKGTQGLKVNVGAGPAGRHATRPRAALPTRGPPAQTQRPWAACRVPAEHQPCPPNSPRALVTPSTSWVGPRVPAGPLDSPPQKQPTCWTLAFSSRATRGGTESGSQASPDPPDLQGPSSTRQSRT